MCDKSRKYLVEISSILTEKAKRNLCLAQLLITSTKDHVIFWADLFWITSFNESFESFGSMYSYYNRFHYLWTLDLNLTFEHVRFVSCMPYILLVKLVCPQNSLKFNSYLTFIITTNVFFLCSYVIKIVRMIFSLILQSQ